MLELAQFKSMINNLCSAKLVFYTRALHLPVQNHEVTLKELHNKMQGIPTKP